MSSCQIKPQEPGKEDILSQFESIPQANWAWEFFISHGSCDGSISAGTWQQFDCTECLILEFDYKFYCKFGGLQEAKDTEGND